MCATLGDCVRKAPPALTERRSRCQGCGARREVNHHSPAALEHRGQRCVNQDQRRDGVGGNHAINVFGQRGHHRIVQAGALIDGVVYVDINATKGGNHRRRSSGDRITIGEVHRHAYAARSVRFNRCGNLGQATRQHRSSIGVIVCGASERHRRCSDRPSGDHHVVASTRQRDCG